MLTPTLTQSQQALLLLTIPKAVVRNAILSIPTLQFRVSLLEVYESFGDETVEARDDIYVSLERDFGIDAVKTICERWISGYDYTDPLFPAALDKCCMAYLSRPEMIPKVYEEYTIFLLTLLSKLDEENLVIAFNLHRSNTST